MALDRVYSTAEICKLFQISKSTLFRWEREQMLPPVGRDLANQRQYTHEHVQAIRTRRMQQLGARLEQTDRLRDDAALQAIWETITLHKFLGGNVLGLEELAGYRRLSPETISQLLQVALDQYEVGSETFCRILQVAWEKSQVLAREAQADMEV
ncbi:hypothetical protein NKDENANG_03020 [Candidatus Entotheonellaceae bacterium PAL068K]